MMETRAPYVPSFLDCKGARMRVVVGAVSEPSKMSMYLVPAIALLGGGALGYAIGGSLVAGLGGAAIGGAGAYLATKSTDGTSGSGNIAATQGVLHGKIVACVSGANASPAGLPPISGVQSEGLFHWCYIMGEGDAAGSIAAAIVGDEARYQELVLANASKIETVGTPGKVGADEWNFAPGSIASGTRLELPQTWNPWIDEVGNPSGKRIPFPEDGRSSSKLPTGPGGPVPFTYPDPTVATYGSDGSGGEMIHYSAGA